MPMTSDLTPMARCVVRASHDSSLHLLCGRPTQVAQALFDPPPFRADKLSIVYQDVDKASGQRLVWTRRPGSGSMRGDRLMGPHHRAHLPHPAAGSAATP